MPIVLGTVGWLVDSVCLALIELVVVFLCARVYLYLAALYVVFIHLYLGKKLTVGCIGCVGARNGWY